MTNENRVGQWAYFDEATEEWVSVPTTIEDDYLTAEVSHFSTWTILIPDYTVLIIGVSIGGVIALLIIGSVNKKNLRVTLIEVIHGLSAGFSMDD